MASTTGRVDGETAGGVVLGGEADPRAASGRHRRARRVASGHEQAGLGEVEKDEGSVEHPEALAHRFGQRPGDEVDRPPQGGDGDAEGDLEEDEAEGQERQGAAPIRPLPRTRARSPAPMAS